ncbi:MAG: penicillin-binding protein 2 [Nitrospina sp.]|nr:penicillin-binding protein 2 [Nitrospina sp.]
MFRYSIETSDAIKKKIRLFAILVVFAFLCLIMRIWYLQILKWQYLSHLSENNRVRMVSLPAYRGKIKDRNDEILANIRPSFNLYITVEDTRDPEASLNFLEKKIPIERSKLKLKMSREKPFKDILIKADITREEVAFVEENNMQLPGIKIKAEPLRNYVHKSLMSHALGYLGEISKSKLNSGDESFYNLGDFVGKSGLEHVFESTLRGKKGNKEVEADVSGRELKVLRKLPSQSGNNLVLTIDVKIQKELEKAMAKNPEKITNGSVVVIKVQTGEILAIASKPSFDPNKFASGISQKNWKKLVNDEMHPLQNRSIHSQYPPGSVYKIAVAYAALEEGVIDAESKINCPGSFKLGRGKYRCWKKKGHGALKLHDALVQSCDVYFYNLGHRLGIDTLAHYATKFGFGKTTGIGLNREKNGLVPTTQWKLKDRKQPWFLGETISASIGQGYNLVTPLQQANMMVAVANGGMLLKPYLVKRIENPDGRILNEFFPEIKGKIGGKSENLEIIRKALHDVVNGPKGTGRKAKLDDIVVSGKTGTVQVVRMKIKKELKKEEIPYKHRDHAWFVGFAPYEKPEIVVAVLIEHGGHGGATAAPIAKKIIKKYFQLYPLKPAA